MVATQNTQEPFANAATNLIDEHRRYFASNIASPKQGKMILRSLQNVQK